MNRLYVSHGVSFRLWPDDPPQETAPFWSGRRFPVGGAVPYILSWRAAACAGVVSCPPSGPLLTAGSGHSP